MPLTASTVISVVSLAKDSYTRSVIPVEAVDGLPPYVYTLSDLLPQGLSFNTSTGALSGTPTQVTQLSYDVTILDANTETSTSSFSLVVQSEIIPYLERIAASLETIVNASLTSGVRTIGPYDWLKPTEVYTWYNQDLAVLRPSTGTIETIVTDVNTITSSLPKFL